MAGRTDRLIEPHLSDGETIEATLRGLISGYTRWSTIGSIGAVLVAFIAVSALQLNLLVSLVILVGAIVAAFMATLYLVGRPLAARHDPTLGSPYVALALTNRRLMLVEQGTGKAVSSLVEDDLRSQISGVEYAKGGFLSPQRLAYRTKAGDRSFEFPRMERVGTFADALKG